MSIPLQIHSLWLECIQQRAGHEGRVRYIRQTIIVCHGSYARGEEENSVSWRSLPENGFAIAAHFGIRSDDTPESQEIRNWMGTLNKKPENASNKPGSDAESSHGPEVADTIADNTTKAVSVMDISAKRLPPFQDNVGSRESCCEGARSKYNTGIALTRKSTKKAKGSMWTCVKRYSMTASVWEVRLGVSELLSVDSSLAINVWCRRLL